MGDLQPIAFDIETSGFDKEDVVTVAGLAHRLSVIILLNTNGQTVAAEPLEELLSEHTTTRVQFETVPNETELLYRLNSICDRKINPDKHYLTAYHGETWNGGFDLPYVRTACVSHNIDWPFPDMAYADMMDVMNRFDTGDKNDLVGVYDYLIGEETCDPFEDSKEAVDAFEQRNWEPLLLHNFADIKRTHELAMLAGRYVAKSDFRMKNLSPPD